MEKVLRQSVRPQARGHAPLSAIDGASRASFSADQQILLIFY